MFKFLLILLLISFLLCVLLTFVLFVVDVIRWHDPEKLVNITPSSPAPEREPTSDAAAEEAEGGDSDAGSNEYNSSAFSVPWGQS